MKGINILESKTETQTYFEYLKNNTDEFFSSYSDIFDSDLKEFFNCICLKKKKVLITSYFQDKFYYRLKIFLVFCMSMVMEFYMEKHQVRI